MPMPGICTMNVAMNVKARVQEALPQGTSPSHKCAHMQIFAVQTVVQTHVTIV